MIRSLFDYLRCLAVTLADERGRRLLWGHAAGTPALVAVDREDALRKAVGYLLRAQQEGTDQGMGSYHLAQGWGASYPETTGYAIPTLLEAGRTLNWAEPMDAAVRAADWLLTVQRRDGGWQGGRIGEDRPSIVFNTAQVVRGMLAAHAHTGAAKYRDAAIRAGKWIASVQDEDGAWRSSNFMGTARVYDTYVDAPLLSLHALTGEEVFRMKALCNLQWVLIQRTTNGWFANADNTLRHNQRPITHTIAYTLDGLLECAALLGDGTYQAAALAPAKALAVQALGGTMHGRYDATWRGTEHPIMTGCAQLSIVWWRVFVLTGDPLYRDAARTMLQRLCAVQRISDRGPAAIHGALPGSFPLWGRYEKFAFPNWGTKYFADALLCVDGTTTKA